MKLLVTGGMGFLGKPFVDRCIKDGHEVILIGRHKSDNPKVRSLVADITDRTALIALKEQVGVLDAIVHLGALVYKKPEEDVAVDMITSNALGTAHILDVFGEDTKVVIYGSTAEVYGLSDTQGIINEDLLPQPPSYYGASKLAGEYICQVFSRRQHVPVVMLRFSVMYGAPDPIARAIPNFIKKAAHNEPLEIYGGEELRDYLHVKDAVESIMLSLKAKKTAVYNVGSGAGVSVLDAARAIIRCSESNSELLTLPRQKEAVDLVLDISAIKNELQYRPTFEFPEGIEEQVAWQKNL